MIATIAKIAVIAAIAEKKKVSDRNDHIGNHFPAISMISATTIACRCDRWNMVSI